MVFVPKIIVFVLGTIIWILKTLVSDIKTMVSRHETIFSLIGKMVPVDKRIFSLATTMVCGMHAIVTTTGTTVTAAQKMVCRSPRPLSELSGKASPIRKSIRHRFNVSGYFHKHAFVGVAALR